MNNSDLLNLLNYLLCIIFLVTAKCKLSNSLLITKIIRQSCAFQIICKYINEDNATIYYVTSYNLENDVV